MYFFKCLTNSYLSSNSSIYFQNIRILTFCERDMAGTPAAENKYFHKYESI